MNILDLLMADGMQPKLLASKDGGEYGSACPACGGGKNPDRFRTWPERDRYWCRQCGKAGDAIQYLRDFKGMSYKAACEHLGVEVKEKDPHQVRPRHTWTPHIYDTPNPVWLGTATRFLTRAAETLHGGQHTEVMDWLMAERCLHEESIRTFHLGYCPKDVYMERPSWGLEPKQDERTGHPKKVWLPQGVVIPCYYEHVLHRLRIRRRNVEERKYILIPGSDSLPLIAQNHAEHTLIVESELDAMLVNQECAGLVNVIAMGTVSLRPDANTHRILMRSKSILVALDAGEEPGAKSSWAWWREHYKHALRCVMVGGKDPTEAMKNGVILKDWIEAALRGGAMRMSA